MRIYSLGSLNIDYVYSVDSFVRAGQTLASDGMTVFPGGKGLNQSVALARAGATVIVGALLGEGGEFLADVLKDSGADVSRIEKVAATSGHAIIQVDREGQNCILLYAGTNHFIDEGYVDRFLSDAEEGDVLLLQNEISALSYIFETAHSKGMRIAFNPSPYNENINKLPLEYVSLWFCNEIEGAALFGSDDPDMIAKAFLEKYPHSALVLTLGEEGSVYVDKTEHIRAPIYKTSVVDTTGAGDTFSGYFLACMASGESRARCLDIASRAASIAVSRKGAASSIPTRSEVIG